MANIGRVWKRLFERDLNLRIFPVFSYLPNRYHMPPLPGLGSNAIRYANNRVASAAGLANYSTGVISWEWTSPLFITVGAFARLEWVLDNGPLFGRFTVYYGVSGVDWYKQEGEASNPAWPIFTAATGPTWIIAPIPGKVLGTFNPTPWRWTYGPPQ